jgi:hypothetical protein
VAFLNVGMTYQYHLRQRENAQAAYRQALDLDEGLASAISVHEDNFQ